MFVRPKAMCKQCHKGQEQRQRHTYPELVDETYLQHCHDWVSRLWNCYSISTACGSCGSRKAIIIALLKTSDHTTLATNPFAPVGPPRFAVQGEGMGFGLGSASLCFRHLRFTSTYTYNVLLMVGLT